MFTVGERGSIITGFQTEPLLAMWRADWKQREVPVAWGEHGPEPEQC